MFDRSNRAHEAPLPGFISANIHNIFDFRPVVNYAHCAVETPLKARLRNPDAARTCPARRPLASFDRFCARSHTYHAGEPFAMIDGNDLLTVRNSTFADAAPLLDRRRVGG